MHRTFHVALGGAALTLGAVVALPGVALAQQVDCDDDQVAAAYPDICVDLPDEVDGGTTSPGTGPGSPGGTAGGGGTTPGTLPFTGDEVLVLSIAGAGALAAGTAMVVAGRRRGTPTA